MVMRHGERLDDLFRSEKVTWKMHCNTNTQYKQWDPRMPTTLAPLEHRPLKDFADDPPLSAQGELMAKMVGDVLMDKGLIFDAIYCSPSLRCIQTAQFLSKQFGSQQPKIRIEPALYGTSYMHIEEPRDWISVEDVIQAGYNIDVDYQSSVTQEDVWSGRKQITAYNARIHAILDVILELEAARNPGGKLLIVGHASTPELVAGYFCNPQRITQLSDLAEIGSQVPYTGNLVFQKQKSGQYSGNPDVAPISIDLFSNKVDGEFLLR